MGEKEQRNGMNRRDFLKNSAYASYATPVVLSLLVEKASACQSWGAGHDEHPDPKPHREVHRRSRRHKKDIKVL